MNMETELQPEFFEDLEYKSKLAFHALKTWRKEVNSIDLSPQDAQLLGTTFIYYKLHLNMISRDLAQVKNTLGIDDYEFAFQWSVLEGINMATAISEAKQGKYQEVKRHLEELAKRIKEAKGSDWMAKIIDMMPGEGQPYHPPPLPWEDERIILDFRNNQQQ